MNLRVMHDHQENPGMGAILITLDPEDLARIWELALAYFSDEDEGLFSFLNVKLSVDVNQ